MINQTQCFCINVFVFIFGASGPGVRSIQEIAQLDIDFSCVGIVKESEPCDQSVVSEGRPLDLLQERCDTSGHALTLSRSGLCSKLPDMHS